MDSILILFPKSAKLVGDSMIQTRDKGWIECLSFRHGLSMQLTKDMSNTRRTSGKPNVQEIIITKYMDKTSPLMYQLCCAGTAIKDKVVIEFAQIENNKYTPYMKYTLGDVIISSIYTALGEVVNSLPQAHASIEGDTPIPTVSNRGDLPVETISLSFNHIQWEWAVQANTGVSSGTTSGVWDVTKNLAK